MDELNAYFHGPYGPCGAQQQQQLEQLSSSPSCTDMIGDVMAACDTDQNGAVDACEMYECVVLMEGSYREDACPSSYDARPVTADTCKPCLADYQNGAETKLYPLDFYDLPLCASSTSTTAAKKTQLKTLKQTQALRKSFKDIHRALKRERQL